MNNPVITPAFSRWCRTAGLRSAYAARGTTTTNWTGHGRHWRVTESGAFEMSGRAFDCWANSTAASAPADMLPTNARQVRGLVEFMLGGGLAVRP